MMEFEEKEKINSTKVAITNIKQISVVGGTRCMYVGEPAESTISSLGIWRDYNESNEFGD